MGKPGIELVLDGEHRTPVRFLHFVTNTVRTRRVFLCYELVVKHWLTVAHFLRSIGRCRGISWPCWTTQWKCGTSRRAR
jgi:hypothetical protein